MNALYSRTVPDNRDLSPVKPRIGQNVTTKLGQSIRQTRLAP